MKNSPRIFVNANVLPTVVVITMLMVLSVLVLLSLWEMESQLFVRNTYIKARRADLRSALALYCSYPGIYAQGGTNTVTLYDSVASSEVKFDRFSWGLYEAVSVTSTYGRVNISALTGLRRDSRHNTALYCANNNGSLTLTGHTNIRGLIYVPKNGIIYGQMRSVFFSGEKISPSEIKVSAPALPEPDGQAKRDATRLLDLLDGSKEPLSADSVTVSFYGDNEPLILSVQERLMENRQLSGRVVLTADKVRIDSTCTLDNIIVVGKSVTIGHGFRGALQVFASDSLILEQRVQLEYPSGIYSTNYAELNDEAVVNGYAVVQPSNSPDVRKRNYFQSRQACVRGLLYVDGNAQLQGIVSGTAYISRAVYYSNEGYYKDMVYDATVLCGGQMVHPMWLNARGQREIIKYVE